MRSLALGESACSSADGQVVQGAIEQTSDNIAQGVLKRNNTTADQGKFAEELAERHSRAIERSPYPSRKIVLQRKEAADPRVMTCRDTPEIPRLTPRSFSRWGEKGDL
jgi:hypothetical protein